MIDFVRYICLKHIAVGPMSLPERFEDVSNTLYAHHVSIDEHAHLNLTDRHENRGKITRF